MLFVSLYSFFAQMSLVRAPLFCNQNLRVPKLYTTSPSLRTAAANAGLGLVAQHGRHGFVVLWRQQRPKLIPVQPGVRAVAARQAAGQQLRSVEEDLT